MSRSMTRPTKSHVRTVNIQISLGIGLVWSVFVVRSKESQESNASFVRTAKTLSDLANGQADLSFRWAHVSFVGFVMIWLI